MALMISALAVRFPAGCGGRVAFAPLRSRRRRFGSGRIRYRRSSAGVVVVRDVGGGEAGAEAAALVAEEAAVTVAQVLEHFVVRHGVFALLLGAREIQNLRRENTFSASLFLLRGRLSVRNRSSRS